MSNIKIRPWELAQEVVDLRAEITELRDSLDLMLEANHRAIKAWQKAHPNKQQIMPDQADMVEWLLDENAALRADKERLDWLATPNGSEWLYWFLYRNISVDRAAIDAERKEAQP